MKYILKIVLETIVLLALIYVLILIGHNDNIFFRSVALLSLIVMINKEGGK